MNDYPTSFVAQSKPLVILSGWARPEGSLSQETSKLLSNGPRIGSSLPPIDSARGEELHKAFMSFDAGEKLIPEEQSPVTRSASISFRLKSCGRQYVYPCRKASPLASEVGSAMMGSGSTTLHSPLSPLSRGSPVYVDGIMTPLWPRKYHESVPSVLLLFFHIGSNPQNNVLRDNHLKSEINNVKNHLVESNYRTKVAVVLVGEDAMRECYDVEERLTNIRKATKLDSKSTFFYLPPETPKSELAHFTESVLSALRPTCLEFYKTQYKHSKRKKDKKGESSPLSPTIEGLSQDLPRAGWNARYEYKMAMLSEFRLDMDAAARHYKEVIDLLMISGGLFDSYSSWSPRWNELRLLADSSALRRIRCLLANGLPSSAAKFWRSYRDTTKKLLERKGKGSSTYGWQAWESRFARCMAEIIPSTFAIITDSAAKKTVEVLSRRLKYPYAPAEKVLQSDKFHPWEFLHHPGYWLSLSAQHSEARRELAMAIPAEDLLPPGQSPATRVAFRNETYDTYLCPEPHVEGKEYDHKRETMQALEKTIVEFTERKQIWMTDRLRFAKAAKSTQDSHDVGVLLQLWRENRWRRPGWAPLTRRVAIDLFVLAQQANDFKTQILTAWELLNSSLGTNNVQVQELDDLIQKASDASKEEENTTVLEIKEEDVSSFLQLDFVFEKESENLGETLRAQVLISSNAHSGSKPITLSEVVINFQGDMPTISLRNSLDSSTENSKSEIHQVSLQGLEDNQNSLFGEADLTIFPRQTRIMALQLPLQSSGKISAVGTKAVISKPNFRLEYSKSLGIGGDDIRWHVMREKGMSRKRRFRWTSCQEVNILPKLPKLKIRLPNLASEYYVGEKVVIDIELTNDEAWDIEGSLDVRILADSQDVVQPSLLDRPSMIGEYASDNQIIQTARIEKLAPTAKHKSFAVVRMPSQPYEDLSFEIEVQYNGARESDSEVSKTMSAKLIIVEPITATYTVSPDLHTDPWPSYFAVPDLSSPSDKVSPGGISSRWNLQTQLAGPAGHDLSIDKVELVLQDLSLGAKSSVLSGNNQTVLLAPNEIHEVNFTIDVTKSSLENISASLFDPTLNIYWRRADSTNYRCFKKILAAPRLSLPSSEPRVIATRVESEDSTVLIDIHLENPSMHYLSFEYGIESNDDFAFSGPKLATVHLVPMSKHCVRFVLMPLVRGAYIQPTFKVVDIYFNKSLRVNAGKGLVRELGGNLLLWIDQ